MAGGEGGRGQPAHHLAAGQIAEAEKAAGLLHLVVGEVPAVLDLLAESLTDGLGVGAVGQGVAVDQLVGVGVAEARSEVGTGGRQVALPRGGQAGCDGQEGCCQNCFCHAEGCHNVAAQPVRGCVP